VERLDDDQLSRLVDELDELYGQLDRIAIDETLVRRAGALAQEHALRGYDAVHLAGVERVAGEDTVLVSGDAELCADAHRLGIAVSDTSITGQWPSRNPRPSAAPRRAPPPHRRGHRRP
jgi:uncharacterized protein